MNIYTVQDVMKEDQDWYLQVTPQEINKER